MAGQMLVFSTLTGWSLRTRVQKVLPTTFQYLKWTIRSFTLTHYSELLMRIELTTSSLPRKCSTTELQQHSCRCSFIVASCSRYEQRITTTINDSERETRFELATYSLEGYRSTNWATPAYASLRRASPLSKYKISVGRTGFEPVKT